MIYIYLGACLQEIKKYSEALSIFDKALKIKPNDEWVQTRKSIILTFICRIM